MQPQVILDTPQFSLTIDRLCRELTENHADFSRSVLLGVQPRGVYLANRIHDRLSRIRKDIEVTYGKLDVTFYRDDFRRREKPLEAADTEIPFSIEGKQVVLIDDVLFTGRTIRAALDALLDFGRPEKVELLVLIDRRFSRHLPVQPDYIGKAIDSIASEKVKVEWEETHGADRVIIHTAKSSKT